MLVPGEVGLVAAGAAAAQNGTPIALIIVAASLGAVAGDTGGYLIGRRFGADVIENWRFARWLRPGLKRARRYFDRRGGAAVAGARWVGALRAVVPVVAGTARMPAPRFAAWDAPSAVAWCAVVVTVGFVWGDDIADLVDRIGLGISAVVVIALIVAFVIVKRRRSSGSSDEQRSSDRTDGLEVHG